MTNSATPVCTSVDAGPGIGVGTGQINSLLCSPSTIGSGVDYGLYVFADKLYLTPVAGRAFGDYVAGRIKARW